MDTITVELFSFRELDAEARAKALLRVSKEYSCQLIDAVHFMDLNRHRFYKNGMPFDALGIEESK